MRRHALIAIAVTSALLTPRQADPCTVGVFAGSATASGRPMLWKNRDSDHPDNRVMRFGGEGFPFIGLVNGEDVEGLEVWAGVNSAGFCIMNSASYNLYPDDEDDAAFEARRKDEEGLLMKLALGRCATVDDFARFLEETAGDRGVEANFGVIDSTGGAAFFETTNTTFVRFDAADRRVAPNGYILRTNFSHTGEPNQGAGEIRFDRAAALFHRAAATGGIGRDWLLLTASRDMVNGLTDEDPLDRELPAHARDPRYVAVNDTLVRDAATSTILFEGVTQGEDPARTVMWARVGHPLCSVVLPHWLASAGSMTLTVGTAPPLVRFAAYWFDRVFPFAGTSRDRYMDLAPVLNRQGTGILPRLVEVEEEVLGATDRALVRLPPESGGLDRVQTEVENLARTRLRALFPEAAAASGL